MTARIPHSLRVSALDWLFRGTAFLLLILAAAYTVGLAREDLAAADLVVAAERIETDSTPAADWLRSMEADRETLVLETCRSSILRAALSVTMALMDDEDVSRDYESWERALGVAVRLTDHYVRCLPNDGNGWLRQAFVLRAVAEETLSLSADVTNSILFAPAERSVIDARMSFWPLLSDATQQASKAVIASDVETVLRYGDSNDLHLLATNLPRAQRQTFVDLYLRLDDGRRRVVDRALNLSGGSRR